MDGVDDPDVFALVLVQQFLAERGWQKALREVELAAGSTYYEGRAPRGSMLLEMVYKDFEHRMVESPVNEENARIQAEEDELLHGGEDDFPQSLMSNLEGLHSSNIISVVSTEQKVITGAGDGTVQCLDMEGIIHWRTPLSHGGVLSLAIKQAQRDDETLLLLGTMDGSVIVLNATSGIFLASDRPHNKYCVRSIWSPDGTQVVSCAWSGSLAIHTYSGSTVNGDDSSPTDMGMTNCTLRRLHVETYTGAVQDVEWIHEGGLVAVALKGTNYLRLFNTVTLREDRRINMNALGDDHVSFSATQLRRSPCGRFLLVSSDGPRLIMFRLSDWSQARSFYGLPIENFHQPATAWHRSGFYIFVGAAGGQLFVYHVGSSRVVATLRIHDKNVRGLHYDSERNLLVTCSFDRTVKIFQH
eukprot:jgi/Botrbrau1/7699/Bobra.0159s0136.1